MEWLLPLLPAIISAVGALIGTGINSYQQDKANAENKSYATQMTNAQWERDDSSLQRQVEDAKKAGLSPLAVTKAMNTSSPLNYVAQAPQMDLSWLAGLGTSMSSIISEQQENSKDRQSDAENLEKQLAHNLTVLEKTIQRDKDLQQNQIAQDILSLGKQLTYQYDVLNEQSKSHSQDLESDRLIQLSTQSMDLYNSITQSIGMAPRTEYVTDLKTYSEMYNSFMVKYNNFLQDWKNVDMGNITSFNESEGMSSNALKTGVQFSRSNGKQYESKSAMLHDMFAEYFSSAVFPIIIDDKSWTSRSYKYE